MSASPSAVAASVPARAVAANAAIAAERAITCSSPDVASSWYSDKRDAVAAIRAVPIAVPPERDGTLGEIVGMLEQLVDDVIEQFVERDEVGALDVPVRLLGLQSKVEGVGDLLVQQLDCTSAHFLCEIVLRVPERSVHASPSSSVR